MRILSILFLILLVLLGISFATLNSDLVTVNYYVGQQTTPLSLVLISAFGMGGLFGMLAGTILLLNAKMKNYHLRQRLKMAQKEIENLRVIPLQDKRIVLRN